MATPEEVEATLERLIRRFEQLDRSYRTMLSSDRAVQAELPDVGLVYHTWWRDGHLSDLHPGPAPEADIRIECDSDDLIAMADGRLAVRTAYATDRVRVEASMSDLLRLQSVL